MLSTNSQRVKGLLAMSRPKPFLAVVMAWTLGVSVAYGTGYPVDAIKLVWGLTALVFVTASIHYVNEYADWETDALTDRTLYSGGSGVIPSGLVPRSWALTLGWITLVLGFLVYIPAVFLGLFSFETFLVLIVGTFGGWMYSMPPLKLAWRGLGELTNSVLGATLAPLYGYMTLTGRIHPTALAAFLPFTALCFLNLLAVTWPDRRGDAAVGKYTLATVWKPSRLRGLYAAGLVVGYSFLVLSTGIVFPGVVTAAGLLALPLSVYGFTTYTRKKVSGEVVWAMVVMSVAQTAAWIAVGSGYL